MLEAPSPLLAILGILALFALITALAHLTAKRSDGSQRVRMLDWLLLAVSLVIIVGLISPGQFQMMIAKVALVVVSGVIGFFFDRGVAPYARPDSLLLSPMERAAAGIRRALIIFGFVVAGALGA